MIEKPDFSPDTSGPYLRQRLIPKKPGPPTQSMDSGTPTGGDAGLVAQNQPAATAERSKLWFDETVVVPDAFRDIMSNYSHIPAADIDEHVIQIVSGHQPVGPLERNH